MLRRAGQKEPVPATVADQGSGPRLTGGSAGAAGLGFWTLRQREHWLAIVVAATSSSGLNTVQAVFTTTTGHFAFSKMRSTRRPRNRL